nr:MAG TPA: hypothetical protein [Caudoviricetes sp.]
MCSMASAAPARLARSAMPVADLSASLWSCFSNAWSISCFVICRLPPCIDCTIIIHRWSITVKCVLLIY